MRMISKIKNFQKKNTLKYRIDFLILFILTFCFGCKKNTPIDNDEIVSPTTGTRTEFTLDSIFLYARQVYLWNDALPTYSNFAPREKYINIKPEISAFRNELFDISQLKINQLTGKPYEIPNYNNSPKYSYLEIGRSTGGAVQAGTSGAEAVLAEHIMHLDDKVIAYVAIGSFPSLTSAKSELSQAFNQMAVENPKYLVLDLRFNGGGYVETAEYVANLIAPSTLNGEIMYSEQFNSTLQNGKATILRNQPYLDEMGKTVIYNGHMATLADVDYTEKGNTYRFDKKGSLESIKDIYIIVSGQTASASELLISCLKPYFNIKLIGERTYGKPVGFFGINIDRYAVYLSSFLIKNSQGWSDYYDGMVPDVHVVGSPKPILGDQEELCFKAAISAIKGNLKLVKKKELYPSKEISLASALLLLRQPQTDVGIIESRLKLKH